MVDSNIVIKNTKLKAKNIFQKILDFVVNIDVDFIFVACATFILQYSWWQRLLIGIGLIYVYKMVVKDIRTTKRIK